MFTYFHQVHLPDDSKPSIVFNESTGRWENTVDGEQEAVAPTAPPPMMPGVPASNGGVAGGLPGGLGGGAPPPNMSFRAGLTKKRGRAGYVDALSQSGMAKPMTMMAPPLSNGSAAPLPSTPALLDPSTPPSPQDGPESLDFGAGGGGGAPPMMMFNPSSLGSLEPPPAF